MGSRIRQKVMTDRLIVLAVDRLNTGKDGTVIVTAVDGRLFHTGINRAKKEYLYASTKEDN